MVSESNTLTASSEKPLNVSWDCILKGLEIHGSRIPHCWLNRGDCRIFYTEATWLDLGFRAMTFLSLKNYCRERYPYQAIKTEVWRRVGWQYNLLEGLEEVEVRKLWWQIDRVPWQFYKYQSLSSSLLLPCWSLGLPNFLLRYSDII